MVGNLFTWFPTNFRIPTRLLTIPFHGGKARPRQKSAWKQKEQQGMIW
jgi:hypothetical protein